MTAQKTKTYALISDETASKQAFGMCELFIDETIQSELVTKTILDKLKANDTLVVKNIQTLGTSLNEVVETLNLIAEYNINLFLVRENLSFKAKKLPEIASSLLITLKLHQSLISLRSHMALQERKSKGIKLGRPYNSHSKLKLENNKEEIQKLLQSGVSKDKIAEKYGVCRSTVYNFVRKNQEILLGV